MGRIEAAKRTASRLGSLGGQVRTRRTETEQGRLAESRQVGVRHVSNTPVVETIGTLVGGEVKPQVMCRDTTIVDREHSEPSN